jgi:intracellular septation protein A
MKHALFSLFEDMFSTLVFLAVFALTGSALETTAIAIGVGIVQIGWEKWRKRPIAIMQWLSLSLVTIFGAASLLTHDNRFIMAKPTLIYFAVGTAMLKAGWMDRYLPEMVHANLSSGIIVGAGYAWSAMMFALGIGNILVLREYGRDNWILYNSVVPLASKFVAIGLQYLIFRTLVIRNLRRRATL